MAVYYVQVTYIKGKLPGSQTNWDFDKDVLLLVLTSYCKLSVLQGKQVSQLERDEISPN